jgi:hypothetical protein
MTARQFITILSVALPMLSTWVRPLPVPSAAVPAGDRASAAPALVTRLAGALGWPNSLIGLLSISEGLTKVALIVLWLAPP